MTTDYELAFGVKEMYNLKKTGNGPFKIVLREKTDYGVCVGIDETLDSVFFFFRGSVTLGDWARDAISFLPEEKNGTTFPLGFDQGMDESFDNLSYFLKKNKTVFIAGHSLGAAHAAIFHRLITQSGIAGVRRVVIRRVVLMGCPNLSLLPPGGPDKGLISYKNGLDFVCDVPPVPWGPIVDHTIIDGGHDPFPSLFMYHHIDYYLAGIKKWEESQASKT